MIPNFGMGRSEIKRKIMATWKGIERKENMNVERTFGVDLGLAMIQLMKVGSLTRHPSRRVECRGALGGGSLLVECGRLGNG